MDKLLVLGGKAQDKAMSAIRSGRLPYATCKFHTLRPGSCVNTYEEVQGIDFGPLNGIVDPFEDDRLCLWVSSADERHRVRGIEFRTCPEELPNGSWLKIAPQIIVPSWPNYFLMRCRDGLSFVDAYKLGMELCGTYAHDLPGNGRTTCNYFLDPALSSDELRRYLRKVSGVHGAKMAREAARWVLDNSYSDRETETAGYQYLPRRLGGRGFPKPVLNQEIEVPPDKRHLTQRDAFTPDIYWDIPLDLEYDGDEHAIYEQVLRDKARLADIQALDIKVIPATKLSIATFESAELLGEQVGHEMVRGYGYSMVRHLRKLDSFEDRERRRELYAALHAR